MEVARRKQLQYKRAGFANHLHQIWKSTDLLAGCDDTMVQISNVHQGGEEGHLSISQSFSCQATLEKFGHLQCVAAAAAVVGFVLGALWKK